MSTSYLLRTPYLFNTTTKMNSFPMFNLLPQKIPFKNPPPIKISPVFARKPIQTLNSTNSTNPFSELLILVSEKLNYVKKPLISVFLFGLLLAFGPNNALAALTVRKGMDLSPSSSRTISYLQSDHLSNSESDWEKTAITIFLMTTTVANFLLENQRAIQKISVLRLQVGLVGTARSLQKDLDRIAEVADTSTSEGLDYILTETVLVLLRLPDYCISAHSSMEVKQSIEAGEERFKQLSIEERGKFGVKTLINMNNIKKRRTSRQKSRSFSNECIVITILVEVDGVHKIPVINGSADLKEALRKLGSMPSNKTLAVQVLWNPQNENETLEDYSLLRHI